MIVVNKEKQKNSLSRLSTLYTNINTERLFKEKTSTWTTSQNTYQNWRISYTQSTALRSKHKTQRLLTSRAQSFSLLWAIFVMLKNNANNLLDKALQNWTYQPALVGVKEAKTLAQFHLSDIMTVVCSCRKHRFSRSITRFIAASIERDGV